MTSEGPSTRRPNPGERITHGRHCSCSSCARQDWAESGLVCGMHGASCPPVYDPWGRPGDLVAEDRRSSSLGGDPASLTLLRGRSSTEVLATLLEDRNLDAMLSVMRVRSGGDLRGVERWDLRAAIVEVLGWEGIHA